MFHMKRLLFDWLYQEKTHYRMITRENVGKPFAAAKKAENVLQSFSVGIIIK